MSARIIIDVEATGIPGYYRARVAGSGLEITGCSLPDALEGLGMLISSPERLPWYGQPPQQDRDIAARIMAEIEGEQ